MLEFLELREATSIFFYIMISFGFVVGIVLMVAPEVYDPLNKALQREYGLKIRLMPKLETPIDAVDGTLKRHMVLAGMFISSCAFVLLMLVR